MNENMNLIPKIEEIVCKVFNITLSRYYDKHHSIIIRSVNKCESLKGLDKGFYTKYRMCELQVENNLKS